MLIKLAMIILMGTALIMGCLIAAPLIAAALITLCCALKNHFRTAEA